jgi:hypothetical protein
MASGDDKAAAKAGHMAAPTTKCSAQLTLANGVPSTQGALPKDRYRSWKQIVR